jgi:hypothetical protein
MVIDVELGLDTSDGTMSTVLIIAEVHAVFRQCMDLYCPIVAFVVVAD